MPWKSERESCQDETGLKLNKAILFDRMGYKNADNAVSAGILAEVDFQ